MGQNQLLIIILGMVIVSVTIAVAITLVNENAVTSNRDAMATDLISLTTKAKQFYNTPSSMGGGSRSFVGLTADAAGMAKLASTNFSNNGNGIYTILTAGTSSQVVFQGVGKTVIREGEYPTLTCTVTASSQNITIVN